MTAALSFRVLEAKQLPQAASPLLALVVRLTTTPTTEVSSHVASVLLRCQIRIEAGQRAYGHEEKERLRELFGNPGNRAGWARANTSILWATVVSVVPAFEQSTDVEIHVPCTYDLAVAHAKLLHGVDPDSHIPLTLLFSGTAFTNGNAGLAAHPIPWSSEARFALPVSVFRKTLDHHYPNSAALLIQRDVFERLHRYRAGAGLATWEQTLDALLRVAEAS